MNFLIIIISIFAILTSQPCLAQLENRSEQLIMNLWDTPQYFQLFDDTLPAATTIITDFIQLTRSFGCPNYFYLFSKFDTLSGYPNPILTFRLLAALDTPAVILGYRGENPTAFYSPLIPVTIAPISFGDTAYYQIIYLDFIPGSWIKFKFSSSDTTILKLDLWMRH